MSDVLELALLQFEPRLLDAPANAERIAAATRAAGADVLLTPELSLSGYDVRDAAAAPWCAPVAPADLATAAGAGEVIVGLPEPTPDGRVFNTALHLRGGDAVHRHRKLYLPTYGMFDEGRYFAAGDRVDAYRVADGWTAGLLICEDLWHPALPYLLAARGVDVLLVMAAAPGRGVMTTPNSGSGFASAETWTRIVRTTAQLYGIYVALCNRVGVEGGVTFAGGSLIVGPDGRVLAAAEAHVETLLRARLTRAEVLAARAPYAHLRDDDIALFRRELGRILDERR
ncbi:MAG: nitrilase-related carbon-nitrogen hydrolase [Longimicrobiales bacterium]